MVKMDIVDQATQATGLMKFEVKAVFEAIMTSISESISRGEDVSIRGFGTFKMVQRKEKHARDIRKNTLVVIPAHTGLKFIPSPALKIGSSEKDKDDNK